MHPLYENVESLQHIVISQATGGSEDESEYTRLRDTVLADPNLTPLSPRFLRTCRSLGQFWQFIKNKYGTYAERRQYIWAEFHPMLELLEQGGTSPSDQLVSSAIEKFDSSHIQLAWSKALDRRSSDAGAGSHSVDFELDGGAGSVKLRARRHHKM